MAERDLFSRLQRLFSTNVIVRNVGGRKLKIADTAQVQAISSKDLQYVDVQHQITNKYRSQERNMVPGFSTTQKTRPLIIAKLEEMFREESVMVHSQRLIDELFVFIYNGNRAEALKGYNDDLVMSFAIALWVRDTALRLRSEGIELSKKAIQGIGQNPGIYISEVQKNDSWEMDVKGEKEDLTWLIK